MKVADYKGKHNGSIIEAMKDYKADFGCLNDMVTDVNKQIAATESRLMTCAARKWMPILR